MAMAAIYGCDKFYPGSDKVTQDLKSTGFTTVVPSSISVFPHGDLTWGKTVIVQDGVYINDPTSIWPNFLGGLKEGTTSVNRILLSVGGDTHADFTHIHDLIFAAPGSYPNKPNIGPDTPLYKNFKALKDLKSSNGTQAIDAIDLDDEEATIDTPTIVAFSQMLHTIGFGVTFCVYSQTDAWINALYQLNVKGQAPIVTGFNLMTYSCDPPQDPQPWIDAIQAKMYEGFDAAGFVFPGCANRWYDNDPRYQCYYGTCPSNLTSKFKAWKAKGTKGGFVYNYDRILTSLGATDCSPNLPTPTSYAWAILTGLQGTSSEADTAEQFASAATV